MKKLWVIIFLTFFLTGCFDYQELNTRAIISGIAIDYENEEYLLNLEILNNKKSEGEENASAKTYYVEGTGQTISEAFSNCHLKIAKEPYYAHLKVVILSESTAKEKLKEVVDYFIREPSVRNIFLPVVSKNAAAKNILENTSKENPVVSTAIQNLILDNKANDTVSVLKDFEVFTEELINPYLDGYINTISKEEDTLYLAACTKGADRTSIRKQPFSPIPAKQRAWSLKTTYVTQILRKYIFGNEKDEKIIKDIKDIEHRSFEEYMIDMFRPYYGRSQNDLKREFGIASSAKSLNHLIIKKILGLQGDIEATEEFKKANITLKTIRVEEDGHIKESMSFPVIDFFELEKEDVWEESSLYDMLAPVKFMFVIFKMFNNEYVLDRVMFWNMPEQDLEEVKKVWQKTKEKAANGITFKEVNGKIKNDLPKSKENRVAHVRPHGRNRDDISLLPNGQTITKQCFWLNRSYIESIIGSKGKK